ncbi:MAG: hypothetical protein R6X32_14605 [Chloroflexota bacterium]
MSDAPRETQAPQAATADIAAQLDESAPHVIGQIQRIVDHLGAEVAYGFLDKTKQCLAEGGVLTHDGKRKRTAGGTFFFLVRGGVTAEQHQIIWPQHQLPGHLRPRRSKPPRLSPEACPKRRSPRSFTWSSLPASSGPLQAVATCKQWEKVAEALAADENDRLVVTGYRVLDKETEAIVVLGQSVTTTSQQGKRP